MNALLKLDGRVDESRPKSAIDDADMLKCVAYTDLVSKSIVVQSVEDPS